MTENNTAKFIDLTEVFPVYARPTLWQAFGFSPPTITGSTTAAITIDAAKITRMEEVLLPEAMVPSAATHIYGPELSIYVREPRAEILKKLTSTPAPKV